MAADNNDGCVTKNPDQVGEQADEEVTFVESLDERQRRQR